MRWCRAWPFFAISPTGKLRRSRRRISISRNLYRKCIAAPRNRSCSAVRWGNRPASTRCPSCRCTPALRKSCHGNIWDLPRRSDRTRCPDSSVDLSHSRDRWCIDWAARKRNCRSRSWDKSRASNWRDRGLCTSHAPSDRSIAGRGRAGGCRRPRTIRREGRGASRCTAWAPAADFLGRDCCCRRRRNLGAKIEFHARGCMRR